MPLRPYCTLSYALITVSWSTSTTIFLNNFQRNFQQGSRPEKLQTTEEKMLILFNLINFDATALGNEFYQKNGVLNTIEK